VETKTIKSTIHQIYASLRIFQTLTCRNNTFFQKGSSCSKK